MTVLLHSFVVMCEGLRIIQFFLVFWAGLQFNDFPLANRGVSDKIKTVMDTNGYRAACRAEVH